MKHIVKFYFIIPRFGAFHFEAGIPLYRKRLYSLNKWHKETIVEFPLGEFIYTPWSSLRREKQNVLE